MAVPVIPLPLLSPRATSAHKGSVGRVLVVGGSLGMAGAPALAARGALRAGAGLVTLAVPRTILAIAASFQPEVMTVPLPCDDRGEIEPGALERVLEACEHVNAMVVGPGLGREPATRAFVLALLARASVPVVLDADGLYAMQGSVEALATRSGPTVLTPHEGEAAGLLGTDAADVRGTRDASARRLARRGRSVCVLKGPASLVTDGARLRVNETGGPVLATGGSGDVLSGVVAAFLAGLPGTGTDAFGAAVLAVHVHGLAGDLRARAHGDRGVLASEIADAVPEAIRAVIAASGGP